MQATQHCWLRNVFGYNYGEDARFDDIWWLTGSPSINHAPHSMMNLWENNVGTMVSGDFIWGSCSHNTVYRSRSRGWQREETTANNSAVSLATGNLHINVVGCVLRAGSWESPRSSPGDGDDWRRPQSAAPATRCRKLAS